MNTNKMKRETLVAMRMQVNELEQKLQILDALDRDSASSGYLDIHDQLTTLDVLKIGLLAAIKRAFEVVPS